MTHNRWHPDLAPAVTVAPGEELTLLTEDGLAGQLTRESTHAACAAIDLGLGHPLAGPVEVTGAEPGDVLEVEFVEYLAADFGVTAVIPGFGFLPDRFPEPFLVKWEIENGVARSRELPGVAVPAEIFAGVAGVAPSRGRMEDIRRREERIRERGGPVADLSPESAVPQSAADGLRTIPPREIGGNLDIRHLIAGSRLYLPVDVPGALFSIGDLHFAQGDGEVCGTAIEVAGSVTLRLHLHRDHARRSRFPSFETPARPGRASFATTGIPVDDGMDLTVAVREALTAMIDYLVAARGLEPVAAYALCSAVVDLRLSEVVDIPYPLVAALLPLDVFEGSGMTISGLDGSVAVVTGAGSGIGAACRRLLEESGASVVAIDLAGASPADVTDRSALDRIAERVEVEHGGLDVLINAAGILTPNLPVDELPVDDFRRNYEVNVIGTVNTCQAFGALLRARRGAVVNVASQAALVSLPQQAAYTAAKGAVAALTRSLAIDWAASGVRVNAVAPGFTLTPMTAAFFENETFTRAATGRIPLGRILDADEIAAAIVFLASPLASAITGVVLPVDGGWTAGEPALPW